MTTNKSCSTDAAPAIVNCSSTFYSKYHGFRIYYGSDRKDVVVRTPLRNITVSMEAVMKQTAAKATVLANVTGYDVENAILELTLNRKEWKILRTAMREERRTRLGRTFRQYMKELRSEALSPITRREMVWAKEHWQEEQRRLRNEFRKLKP